MAKTAQAGTSKENPKAQGSEKGEKKKKGILPMVITLVLVFAIIIGILGGAFYLTIHNNLNGLADRYRSSLQGIPILKLALPAAADPLDPKNLTADELKAKYSDFRKSNTDLTLQLDAAKKELDNLRNVQTENETLKADAEKLKSDMDAKQKELDQQKADMDKYKKEIDTLVAKGDTAGFKAYFEKVDPEVAKQVYAEIVQREQTDANVKKFAQVYEVMDPSSAASIFEKMGNNKIDMIAETLKAMKKESSSQILAAMTPAFASKLTEKLNSLYKGNK